MDFTMAYTYVMDGTKSSLNLSNKGYSVEGNSGLAIRYNSDGNIKNMKNLSSARITALTATTAQAGSQKYTLADEVQVYLYQSGTYYLTTLSAVNTTDYTLTGWYDNTGCSAGGQIRVIIATAK